MCVFVWFVSMRLAGRKNPSRSRGLPAFHCRSASFAGGGRETERCCQLSAHWPYFALLFGLSSAAVDIVT